ncbi:hypothetical protein W97_06930 [Coniosporium apollinis CBS 100218]|uniref:Helicase C-terminal domain-containing protein n=1 Tax=Coniosporium apollinis (strain CBS 100218) TaxID=1168221 RepID=R7Z085_CONA1|nr:uncharacterized protein W97_06930 [Coniosporium apollinis CBS 100218]EON67562.1 hypothetical protein W97_06930 [Coniosporium apollinis CBS 100218]
MALETLLSNEMDMNYRWWKFPAINVVDRYASHRYKVKDLKFGDGELDPAAEVFYWLFKIEGQMEQGDTALSVPDLRETSPAEIQSYEEMQRWLGNPDLQSADLEAACKRLGIPNPDRSQMPEARRLRGFIGEIVVLKQEKLAIWVVRPLNTDVRSYRADLSQGQRTDLAFDLHEEKHKCTILICSYLVSACSLNLLGHCRVIILFEPSPNDSILRQVLGRQLRCGQKKWIRLISLVLEESFNLRQNANNLVKALPGLITCLNLEVWGDGTDGEVGLGDWVPYRGQLYQANAPTVAGMNLNVLLDDALLVLVYKALAGEELSFEDSMVETAAQQGAQQREGGKAQDEGKERKEGVRKMEAEGRRGGEGFYARWRQDGAAGVIDWVSDDD